MRTALAANYIEHGDDWMAALDARNAMSHIYDRVAFETVALAVRDCYLPMFERLYDMLLTERIKLEGAL